MARQLDILAIEPYFGHSRKWMLETLQHTSRHRWNLLKLPARRLDRRLATAALWFSEQLQRHPVRQVDLLFVSDALNLADFFRLCPSLAGVPVVLYFHDHELTHGADSDLDGAISNLSSLSLASQAWFNSRFHQDLFVYRAAQLEKTRPELYGSFSEQRLRAKSRVMTPPVLFDVQPSLFQQTRRRRRILIDTHDADEELLTASLTLLASRGQIFDLVCFGPQNVLPADFIHRHIPDTDIPALTCALTECGSFMSFRRNSLFDPLPLLALQRGASPLMPSEGHYVESLPPGLHEWNLYQPYPEPLVDRLLDHWTMQPPGVLQSATQWLKEQNDPVALTTAFDDALFVVAEQNGPSHGPSTNPPSATTPSTANETPIALTGV